MYVCMYNLAIDYLYQTNSELVIYIIVKEVIFLPNKFLTAILNFKTTECILDRIKSSRFIFESCKGVGLTSLC